MTGEMRRARPNRAERRKVKHSPRSLEARMMKVDRLEQHVRTLPGVPGGPPYVSEKDRFDVVGRFVDGLRAITPFMAYRVAWWRRVLGVDPPVLRRLRYVRESVPGIGEGVVLGEFTDAPAESPLRKLILP